jgi:HAL2 family 3'(2'),5'-bisphosphate nucleotidase
MDKEKMFAIEVISKAVVFTKKLQQQKTTLFFEKDDKSPVTAADFGSQLLVTHYLQKYFPDDSLAAEENILELSEGKKPVLQLITDLLSKEIEDFSFEKIIAGEENRAKRNGKRLWVLDPIDGTKGFLRGEQFATAFSLMEKDQPVLGVLGCPNLNDRAEPDTSGKGVIAYAIRGQGAYIQEIDQSVAPSRLSVSNCTNPALARFVSSVDSTGHSNSDAIQSLKSHLGNQEEIKQFDSQAKYVMVAAGKFDLFLRLPPAHNPDYHEKIWDHAAGSLIVEEAGGVVTDISGKRFDFSQGRSLEKNRGVVVSNGPFHDAIVDYLSGDNMG